MKKLYNHCKYNFIKATSMLLFFVCCTTNIFANIYNVTSTADFPVGGNNATGVSTNGSVTFRSALQAANNLGGTHTINVPIGTYNLTLGTITLNDIAQNITIVGAGAATTIINMTTTMQDRILLVGATGLQADMVMSISGLTFKGGKTISDNFGGGAIIAGGPNNSLTLNNCKFESNTIDATQGGSGGAVRYNGGGNLTVTNCEFVSNSNPVDDGGALSYFLENIAGAGNGAVLIENNTFTSNTASASRGGALHIGAAGQSSGGITFSATVRKNIFTNNSGQLGGGAIVVNNSFSTSNTVLIEYNRIVNNSATMGTSSTGLAVISTQGNVNANNNWWGCNTSPLTNTGLCNAAAIIGMGGTGTLTASKWLQVKTSNSASPICHTTGTSTITASFLSNSANEAITTADLSAIIGSPITFSASSGTISSAQGSIQAAGTATATYTAPATAGTHTVNAVVNAVPTSDLTARTSIVVNKPTLTAASQTNLACFGGNNGAASVAPASGGTAPYTYNWTPGNPTGDGSVSVSGLIAGAWTCTTTDANGCTASVLFNVTQPTQLMLDANTQINVSCFGGNNGAASVNIATGGAGGYTYNWTPGNPTGDGTTSVTGLTEGTWTCTVTDANGCIAFRNFIITQPATASTAPTAINPQVYAGTATITNLTATGTGLTWYANATGGTALLSTDALVDGTTYHVSQGAPTCESARTPVTVRRISDATQNFCAGATVANLISTPSTGTTASWFTAASGGTALLTTDAVTAGTYYVEQSTPTSNRVQVIVSITPAPTTAAAGPDLTACVSPATATMAANTPTVGTGAWSQISGPVTTSLGANNPTTIVVGLNTAGTYTYVWTITNGTCAPSRDTVNIVVNPNPALFTLAGGGTFCPSTQTLTGPTDPNYTYVWQKSLTGIANPNSFTAFGGALATQDVTNSGVYRLVVSNQFGCTTTDTAAVSLADYVFNGSLAAGDAQQTGRMNRFATLSTCAAPKGFPGDFTVSGARFYDSYTLTNPNSSPVCATIGLRSDCGTTLFSAAYTGSFNPASVSTNYLADPGSSFPGTSFYEATIPANGTIVVVVHEVNPGTGCAGYQLTVDVPRDMTAVTATPSTVNVNATASLAAPLATTYLWSPGAATTQNITSAPITANATKYYVDLGYGNNGCTRKDSVTINLNCTTPTLTCPTNTTVAACQTQAAVNTAFATWLATASGANGTNGVLTNNNTGAPAACGGSTTVTFTYTNDCPPLVTNCQATFTVATAPPVVLTAPTNTTAAACQTQAAVNTAFATWLATASASGGCNGVLTNNNTGSPAACGGSTTVTFTYTSSCAPTTTTAQRTFTVAAAPTVVLTAPTNTTAAACQTQAAVNTAFATWLATASASGGCNGVLTNNNTGAPAACGGSTTVTFTYTSSCAPTTTTVQATFTVATPPTIVITCPAPQTVTCTALIPAVNTNNVTVTSGCGVVVTHRGDVTSNQTCANKYTITRTYRATDQCNNFVECTQIITVNDNIAPTITCPSAITVCGPSNVPQVDIAMVTATDNCAGVVTITHQGDVSTPSNTAPYIITRTYRATDVCGNFTECTQLITVNPIATVNTVANQTVCNGSAVAAINFGTTATGGTVVYNWTNNTTSIGLAASGTGNISSFNGVNTGTAPVTATITVTPTFTNNSVSCVGTASTFTITVNPTATVNTVANQTVCNGSAVTAINFGTTATGGTVVYNWTNNTTSIGLAASGTGNIASFNGVNTGTAPVTATITVTPTFTNNSVSCVGTARTFTITVNPTATVNTVANQTVCNGSAVTAINFGTTATGGTVVYNWINNTTSIGLAASGTGNTASFNGVNTGTAPVTATITVTPTFTNNSVSCVGTARTFTITVNPTATVNAIVNQTVCNGSTVTAINFGTTATGGTVVYNWTNNTTSIGLAASGTGNITSFNGVNTGTAPVTATITVTPTFTNNSVSCVGTASTFTITVNPTPTVNAYSNLVYCNATSNTPAVFGSPNTGGTITYAWTNNNTAIGLAASGSGSLPTFTATNPGTAPIFATISVIATITNNGVSCAGPTQTFTITVNPTTRITVQPSNVSLCFGGNAAFTVAATGLNLTYQWQIDNGSGFVNIAGATTTTYIVAPSPNGVNVNGSKYRCVVTGTCGVENSNVVTLTIFPTPTVTLSSPNTLLLPGGITSISANATPAGGTFQWLYNSTVVSGVSGASFGPININQLGEYKVNYTDLNGCRTSSFSLFITGQQSTNVWIFPNPSNGRFNVRLYNQPNETFTVKVFDRLGQLVANSEMRPSGMYAITNVDLRNLAAGIYTVSVVNRYNVPLVTKQIVLAR